MKSMDQEQLEEKVDEVVETESSVENTSKKLFIKGIVSGVGAIAGVAIIAGAIAGYRSPDSIPFATRCLAAIHAPAAMVGGRFISWHDIKTDSDALSLYLSNSGAPASEYTGDIFRTRILHRQMLTLAAEKMAKDLGISISDEQLDKELDEISAASGGKEKVEIDIKKNFGWSLDQYRNRVVRSMLVLQELQKKLLADEKFIEPAKNAAESALAQVKSGKDFATVAKEVSQDSSAASGGDLGFMKPGQTVPEFDKALFSMKRGEISGLIKTEFGYHIIKVEEIKKDRTGKVVEVRARHILIKFPSVVLEIQKWLDNASIYQFVHTAVPARVDTAATAGQK